jgi:hypothetical protein
MVNADDDHFENSTHPVEGYNLSSNLYSKELVCDEPYGQGWSVT